MNLIGIMDYIGVTAFAISGTYVALQKRMDLFGIYVLAFTTACGGGILRDVVMDVGVPLFFSNYSVIFIVLIATTASLLVKKSDGWNIFMLLCDTIGLAVFAIDTGVKAIHSQYNFPQFIFVSTITAVGGGVIRDLLCQRIPVILRKEVYALAAIVGSVFLWFSYDLIGELPAIYSSIAIVILVRVFSALKKANLPIPKKIS